MICGRVAGRKHFVTVPTAYKSLILNKKDIVTVGPVDAVDRAPLWRFNRLGGKVMRPPWVWWAKDAFSTDSRPEGAEALLGADLSPILHLLSTAHPEASVEINWFTLSANTLSSSMTRATFSHAYITVV